MTTVLAAKAAFILSLALATHSSHPLDAAVAPTTNQSPHHVAAPARKAADGALDDYLVSPMHPR